MKTDTYKIQIKKNNAQWIDTGYYLPRGEYTKSTACKHARKLMASAGEFDRHDTVKFRAIDESI